MRLSKTIAGTSATATVATVLYLALSAAPALANGPRTPVEAWLAAQGKRVPRGRLITSPFQFKSSGKKFDSTQLRPKTRQHLDQHLMRLVVGQSRQPMPHDVSVEMKKTSTTKTKTPVNEKHPAKDTRIETKPNTDSSKKTSERGFFGRLLFDVFGI
ncbi:MAG: hypothetical protein KC503_35385 [Myxococcales bacterium]|nr:hypothetical protein [Myxococcales bacterium]